MYTNVELKCNIFHFLTNNSWFKTVKTEHDIGR